MNKYVYQKSLAAMLAVRRPPKIYFKKKKQQKYKVRMWIVYTYPSTYWFSFKHLEQEKKNCHLAC